MQWFFAVILICGTNEPCDHDHFRRIEIGPPVHNEIECYKSVQPLMASLPNGLKEGEYMRWGCSRLSDQKSSP